MTGRDRNSISSRLPKVPWVSLPQDSVVAGTTLIAILLAGCSTEESARPPAPSAAEYTDNVREAAQDPVCHREALANASATVEEFEWNGYGMDSYRDRYTTCVDDLISGLIDGTRNDVDLSGRKLNEANLADAILNRANLQQTSLVGADLSGAILNSVDARDANMRAADLSNASLSLAILDGADLGNADLRQSRLESASFEGASLKSANLSELTLSNVTLRDAVLVDADLRNTHLTLIDFGDADLSGADLSGAEITMADLSLATLDGANLAGVYWNPGTGDPELPADVLPITNAWDLAVHQD